MIPHPDDSVTCLAQADLLLLLAEMLKNPEGWADLDREFDEADLEALARRSGLDRLPDGTARLIDAVEQWRSVDSEAAASEYFRLFDGSLACPPNETIFIRRDKGAVLADIAGFYRGFGFELAEGFDEKHDHLVAELQFVALLLVLVGRAVDSGNSDHREVAQQALTGFLRDHLGLWVGSFAERLEATTTLSFFGAVARLCAACWWTLQTTRDLTDLVGISGPLAEESGTPYECGMCQGEESEREPVPR